MFVPNEYAIQRKEEETVDEMIEKIKKARKVISALIWLALEIGTLLSVIKMIVESLF